MSKLLFKHYWLSVYQTTRKFIYAQRRSINSTAALCYKKTKRGYQFLLRYQPLPELKLIGTNKKANSHGLYPCCVTGSIELGETPQQNVIKEIYEEFNLKIKSQNIKASSINVSSTQMNECVYTFVVDITNAIAVNKTCGDGSFFENVSENHWVSQKQLRKILISKHNPYLSSLGSAYLLFEYVV